jgi:hypothetical protein
MPFVLAALALRALIPAGFMPGASETFGFTAMLCSPGIVGASGVIERFELPPGTGAHSQPHCDFCLAPLLGAPSAKDGACVFAQPPTLTPISFSAQVSSRSPDRAPSARAPPA